QAIRRRVSGATALQYGVPLEVLCNKFSHTRFEPSGWSGNPKIGHAKSLMDYLFRWLELRFLKGEQGILLELSNAKKPHAVAGNAAKALSEIVSLGDAPTCQFCGSLMLRNGSCYRHGMRQHEWMLLKGPQLRSEIPKKIPGARICGTLCHSGRATEGDNDTLLLTPSLRACHVP